MRAASRVLLFALTLLSVARAAPCRAQDGGAAELSPQQVARARQLYACSTTALEEDRFDDAVACLRQLLVLSPVPDTAYYLGYAYQRLGEIGSSIATFEAVLSGVYGTVSDELRARAEADLEASRARLATLVVRVFGPARAAVLVDGAELATVPEREARAFSVDPGTHVVSARSETHELVERRVELARGGSERLDLRPAIRPEPETFDWGVFTGVLIGVVVAIGAAVAIGVALTTEAPRTGGGPFGGSTET